MIDPRVKLFTILLLTTMAITLKNMTALGMILIFSVVVAIVFKANFKAILEYLPKALAIIFGISFLQIFFVRSGEVLFKFGFIMITSDAVFRVFSMIVRLLIILITSSIMITENSSRVIASFSKLRIPYIVSFMVMITLRFIPLYRESFRDALISIQLRGLDLSKVKLTKKIKIFSYLMLPVVYDALSKAEDLAIAMQARGFQAMKTRTNYIELKFSAYDYFLFIFITVVCVSIGIYAL